MAALALALLMQAGAPETPVTKLDCSRGYDATLAAIRQAQGARPMAPPPGTPFGVIEHGASATLYTYTLPGAVGHPSIVKRQVVEKDGAASLDMSGCGWGDTAGFDKLMKQFEELNSQMKASIRR